MAVAVGVEKEGRSVLDIGGGDAGGGKFLVGIASVDEDAGRGACGGGEEKVVLPVAVDVGDGDAGSGAVGAEGEEGLLAIGNVEGGLVG